MFIVSCNILKSMPVLYLNSFNLILDTNKLLFIQTCAISTYLIKIVFSRTCFFQMYLCNSYSHSIYTDKRDSNH